MNMRVRDYLGDEWQVAFIGKYERNEHELVTYRAFMINTSDGTAYPNVRLPIWTVWWTRETVH